MLMILAPCLLRQNSPIAAPQYGQATCMIFAMRSITWCGAIHI
jgi:hypothetical protein